ncbi:MAG: hypothetical protein IPJ65_23985 [Archangiaceae bacterium]|nr:hypothetical protein [Archangiaceae bacterium]
MSSENKLPVPFNNDNRQPDAFHHTNEWTSGKRGGGKVPADLEWRSNPKQRQEELGTNDRVKK